MNLHTHFLDLPPTPHDKLVWGSLDAIPQGGHGAIVEFGVYAGNSLRRIADYVHPRKVWGFDSFEGLPEPWTLSSTVMRPKGHFKLNNIPEFAPNVEIVKGLFADTVPVWAGYVQAVDFIHIDCDLYSSAYTVLSLLNNTIKRNTIILFDEIGTSPEGSRLYERWEEGEYKALVDWCNTYDRKVRPIMRDDRYSASVRVVR